jgi:hypothetical protein
MCEGRAFGEKKAPSSYRYKSPSHSVSATFAAEWRLSVSQSIMPADKRPQVVQERNPKHGTVSSFPKPEMADRHPINRHAGSRFKRTPGIFTPSCRCGRGVRSACTAS